MTVNIINGKVLGLVHGYKFCPACDKAYTPAGYKTHLRSKSHERKLLAHDNHQFKVIADTLVALGAKLLKFAPGEPSEEALRFHLGADEYELEIETVCGRLFIKPHRGAFLHTRFSDPLSAEKLLGEHNVNRHSGKWNFHGLDDGYNETEIEDFFQQLARLLPGAEKNTIGTGGVAHAMAVLNRVRDSHGGKRWRAK
jgi:hypothetical protein